MADEFIQVVTTTATADAFLRAYEAHTGVELDPYWEVASVLERDPEVRAQIEV